MTLVEAANKAVNDLEELLLSECDIDEGLPKKWKRKLAAYRRAILEAVK